MERKVIVNFILLFHVAALSTYNGASCIMGPRKAEMENNKINIKGEIANKENIMIGEGRARKKSSDKIFVFNLIQFGIIQRQALHLGVVHKLCDRLWGRKNLITNCNRIQDCSVLEITGWFSERTSITLLMNGALSKKSLFQLLMLLT